MEIEDNGSIEPNAEALPVEVETPDTEAEATPPSDTGETDVTDADLAQPKKRTAKDRIDELTADKYELRKEIDYLRSKLDAPKQEAPKPVEAESAPDPEKYEAGEFDTRYIKDLARFEAKQEVASAIAAVRQEQQQSQTDADWRARIARAAETMPDFENKVIAGGQRGEWVCTSEMAEALRASDKGPEIAYNLASNPTEAARISRLSPALQLMELGKLEAKLTQPKPKTVTDAPEPPPMARGSGGKFAVQPDTEDFAAFDKQYGS